MKWNLAFLNNSLIIPFEQKPLSFNSKILIISCVADKEVTSLGTNNLIETNFGVVGD